MIVPGPGFRKADPKLLLRIAEGFNKHVPFTVSEAHPLVLAKRGSHTYGTDTPESDHDFIAVVVPPVGYKLGFQNPPHQARWEGVQFVEGDIDVVVYSLEKLAYLLVKGSPQAMELLWLRPEDRLFWTPGWNDVMRHRSAFLSRRAHRTFVGMAQSEAQKSVMHPIRLLRMLVEYLETGTLRVWRGDTDAQELLAIKNGAWDPTDGPHYKLNEEMRQLITRAGVAVNTSPLPENADLEAINALLLSVHLECYNLRERK